MRLLSALGAMALLFASAQAHASDQGPGYITGVQFTGTRMFFTMSGTRGTPPGCSCCNRWELTNNTTSGQSQIAMVLTAYSLNRSVNVYGTGICVAGSNDTEGVNLFVSN
jgi:hypothetical protein